MISNSVGLSNLRALASFFVDFIGRCRLLAPRPLGLPAIIQAVAGAQGKCASADCPAHLAAHTQPCLINFSQSSQGQMLQAPAPGARISVV